MSLAGFPSEVWRNIFRIAVHAPNLQDVRPPSTSSPWVTVPQHSALNDLRSSLHVRTSLARVSQHFREVVTESIPFDTVLVTNANAHVLRTLCLHHAADNASGRRRRGRKILPAFLSIRHLVVHVFPERQQHRAKAIRKDIATVVHYLPHLVTVALAIDPTSRYIDFVLDSRIAFPLYRALLFTATQSLRELVLHGTGKSLFKQAFLKDFLPAFVKLETLVIEDFDGFGYIPIVLPLTMPRLAYLSIPAAPLSFSTATQEPNYPRLRRLHLHVRSDLDETECSSLDAFGKQITCFSITMGGEIGARVHTVRGEHVRRSIFDRFTGLTDLHLACVPSTLCKLLAGLPSTLLHLSITMFVIPNVMVKRKTATDWVSFRPELDVIEALPSIPNRCEKIETVRFEEEKAVRFMQDVVSRGAVQLERLRKLPFTIEDRMGGSLLDSIS
ncbi:hypothetical protein OF83DRAFT_1176663 [Amylostereum chailletii]|nr:hypothetical protein OF83DRAFT_1176663 [Amylostereum chailletii]